MTTFEGPPVDGVDGIGALTLGGFLEEVADRFGGNDAVVFDDPLRAGATVRWTYADLHAEARRTAKALIATGVERGESVGIVMGNRPEAVAAIFGAAMTGAVAVPLSTFAPSPELASMLELADISVVLTQARLLSRRFGDDIRALRPDLPLRQIAVLGEDSWDRFVAQGDAVGDEELDRRIAGVEPDDPALVIFSSGTTSTPKGMLHSNRAPSQQMWVQAQIFGRNERTRMWTALPLFWTAGFNTAVGATLAAGGCWVAQETFEPGEALALMSRERVTEPYTLPHQTAALEEHPDWATTDLSSLTCVFGKSAFARHPSVRGDTGWIMPVGYGLSETCAFVFTHSSDATREATRRSMGKLLPGTQLRVIDSDTGRALGAGEVGELAVKGPTLMLGYLGKEPADCFDEDGFFHTGDSGHVDEHGEVHFGGRRTEMIKTGGANVSPAELEVALRACQPVKLSRIVAVPHPRLDQIVVACIVLKDGADATEADIQAFLRERVSSYKVPKRVLFFAEGEIPMTASDTKVRDEALLALVHQRLAGPIDN
ncbi:MAG: class I adenylate-forming enzyme family protein [Acidimicrobiales bacterium]